MSNSSDLLSGGVELLLNGMGTVFVFLVVLIFSTKIMSAIVSKFPDKEVVAPKKPATNNVPSDELQQIAVAAAAVQAYNSRT